ncbi:MAG TPA: PIG-L family deacetylase [Blastocatellia bacterium]|nr:PIG-L family deacetylase [Blastocatellia bacterium]
MKNRMLRQVVAFVILLTFAFVSPKQLTSPTSADTRAPEDRGAAGLGQALKRLGTIASALHTGAHPDDEDSGLLAYLARGRQARTAYLSLTRGDGGQNLIGPELYETLGVIRTEELLAARRIDGAQQFFTRAFDFGFSKSPQEAFAKWNREAVLADMVRVIRTFRPLVIVSAWSGTPLDGHGHHQASGILTPEAYRAAADPTRFPEQIKGGLRPWQAKKLYVRVPRREEIARGQETPQATLTINDGQFDPLLGRSYYEVAAQGRSQHRSQDQGTLERRGPQYSRLRLVDSAIGQPKEEKDIFEGIDVKLTGIADFAGKQAAELRPALAEIQQAADEALVKYNPLSPSAVTPIVARGLHQLRALKSQLGSMRLMDVERDEVEFLLKQKENDFSDALARSQNVILDCLADDEIVTPGQTFTISIQAYADAGAKWAGIGLLTVAGLTAERLKDNTTTVDGRLMVQQDLKVTVAANAEPTEPYWLKNPRQGDMFVPGTGGSGIEPVATTVARGTVRFEIAGEAVDVVQPAQYRFADKALGEIRRELKVAPAISLAVSPPLLVYPQSNKPLTRDINVTLTNNQKGGAQGTVSLRKVKGLTFAPAEAAFDLKREGEQQTFTFTVTAPAGATDSRHVVAVAQTADGHEYNEDYQRIAYPHIESRLIARRAEVEALSFNVKVAPGLRVGYIEGAGDDIANALKRMDVDVHTIDSKELAAGDLSKYDVIVTGIRVYEVRPDVIANNTRLLDYVKQGGTLIVQYNKNEIAAGNFTPYPVKMRQGMPDRVTDETAQVVLLDPSHPLFNFPNKITEADFAGWVQERGTYFFSEWDAQYKPLLASHDPGEEEKRGGELIAQVGKGYYIYTGYAWFRQLPVGVPGAYRLLANMVSFPKANAARGAAR